MSRRAIKTMTAFEFRGDFTYPTDMSGPDTVSLTAAELATMLSNARAEGEQSATMRLNTQLTERLGSISDQLKQALTELLKLADCLDKASLPDTARHEVHSLMRVACQLIVDGQGDLFVDR